MASLFGSLSKWLSPYPRTARSSKSRSAKCRCIPVLEALEARDNPTAPLVVASSFFDGALYEFDSGTGALKATLVAPNNSSSLLQGPAGLTAGPDANLYISSQFTNSILEYNLATQTLSTFIPSTVLQPIAIAAANGNTNAQFAPAGLSFGPDGDLYVSLNGGQSASSGGAVIRFNITGGASGLTYAGTSATVASGLVQPTGLTFGTASGDTNNLYVCNVGTDTVVKVTGATSASPSSGTFVAAASGGLNYPAAVSWGADGKFYVVDLGATTQQGNVLQYNGDGSFSKILTPTTSGAPGNLQFQFPSGILLDGQGHLLTGNLGPARPPNLAGSINQYNTDGTFVQALVASSQFPSTGTGTSGISPSQLVLLPAPLATNHFKITAPATANTGSPVNFTVTALDQFNDPTGSGYTGTVHFSSTDGSASLPANTTLTNGTGVFSVTLNSPGPQTVSASDTVTLGITGTSGPIAVSTVATKLAVNVPTSATAGTPFAVTVMAEDAGGNLASNYTGTVQFTSTDSHAVLPASAQLSGGFGVFLVTLKTVAGNPWTITAQDTMTSSITGTSANVAVTPAPATYFTVTVPPGTATTGAPFNATVTAFDSYGNTATGYSGTVHFTSSDTAASLPADSPLTNGTGIFPVTLNTAGTQTITAGDKTAVNPAITGTSGPITTRGLVVSGTKVGGSSVEIDFSKPFDPTKLTMYGSGLTTVQDVTLVGQTSNGITGTLYVDPSNMSVTFKATEASLASFFGTNVLPDDKYTLTVVSGTTNGFVDALGAPLDGANNAGHANYTTTFTVANSGKELLSLPDFARGPDSANAINIPAATAGAGIPVTLSNATAVTDVVFTLHYNPTLLTVTGPTTGNLTAGTPTMIDATHATVVFTYHNGTAQNGTVTLGGIVATVPNSAGSQYKAKELLTLSDITVNGAAFTGVAASAIHVNAYLGDVTGNGTIDALDVATANNVATGVATGLPAYTLLDPAIVGDPQGDISVDAGDVSALAAVVAHLPEPTIPAIPSGVTITPVGADPTLSLSGGQASVSVLLDHPNPVGSTGMTEAILSLSYDPKVLSVSPSDVTLGSIPNQGSGWQISSVVDAARGQIAVTLYSTTAITATDAGSLVNIAFHVAPGASVPVSAVQLVNSTMVNGRQFATQVDDAQGQFVLSPGVDRVVVSTDAPAAATVLPAPADATPTAASTEEHVVHTAAANHELPAAVIVSGQTEGPPVAEPTDGASSIGATAIRIDPQVARFGPDNWMVGTAKQTASSVLNSNPLWLPAKDLLTWDGALLGQDWLALPSAANSVNDVDNGSAGNLQLAGERLAPDNSSALDKLFAQLADEDDWGGN
jgi:hypothetical protein